MRASAFSPWRDIERARDGGYRIPHSGTPPSMFAKPPDLVYNPVLRILSRRTQNLFVRLEKDEETDMFLKRYCQGEPAWRYLLTTAFRSCFSLTDTNAMLGRGQMFVASTAQLRFLLQASMRASSVVPFQLSFANAQAAQRAAAPGSGGGGAARADADTGGSKMTFRTFLDIGAGDGTVTSKFIPLLADLPDRPPKGTWKNLFSVGTISDYLGLGRYKKVPGAQAGDSTGSDEASAHEQIRLSEEEILDQTNPRDLRDRVLATEASRSMCSRLRKRGFSSMETCDLADVIAKCVTANALACAL